MNKTFLAKTLFLAGGLLVAVPVLAGAVNVEIFSVTPFSGPTGTIFKHDIKIQGTESYTLSLTCPPGVTAASADGDICRKSVEYPRSATIGYFILNSAVSGYQTVYVKARLIDKTNGYVYDEGSATVGVIGSSDSGTAPASTSTESVSAQTSTTITPSVPPSEMQATACLRLNSNMRYGSTNRTANNEVSSLQQFLHTNGYLAVEPTGFFGRLTLRAVILFQTNNQVPGTGFVGPLTRAALARVTCGA